MTRARRRRRRASPHIGWPLTLALLAPDAQAAAFLPGVEADPPTGDVAPPPAPAPKPAAAPAGNGFRFVFGPWRHGGTLGLDARWLRFGDAPPTRQFVASTEIDWASYLWQPWFMQVRFGVGFAASRDSGGDGGESRSVGGPLSGRFALALFPASRFPFELRGEVSDNRVAGDPLAVDQRTRRITLSQSYQPPIGSYRLNLTVDSSRIQTAELSDSLFALQASAAGQTGPHNLDFSASLSDNERSDAGGRTRLSALSARHGWQGSRDLSVESFATWNEVRVKNSASEGEAGSDVRQISTFATWRPSRANADDPAAPALPGTLQLAGSARIVEARSIGSSTDQRAQAFNATVGATQELGPEWRLTGSGSVGALRTSALDNTNVGATLGLAWTSGGTELGSWRYTPSASTNAGYSDDSANGERRSVGLQFGHAVAREFRLGETEALSLSLSQSAGALWESSTEDLSRALAHSVGVSWQSVGEGGNQRFVGATVSDSRNWATGRGSFQLANLQLTQRAQLTRYAGWSANLTLQATRNESTDVDVFTGERRESRQGWQTFAIGTVNLVQQRVFGVPRLRHSLLVTASSQQLESRAAGDIEAPLQRESVSVESRLDWSIGRLESRLALRAARVEGRVIAGVIARVQRRF